MKKVWINSILFCLLLWACRSSDVSQQNLSFLYNKDLQTFQPDISLDYLSDSTAAVEITINPNNIYFKKERNTGSYVSRLQINYKLFQSYNKSKIFDQDTLYYAITGIPEKTELFYKSFNIKTLKNSKQYLFIKITDLNTSKSERFINQLNNHILLKNENKSIANNFQIKYGSTSADLTPIDSIQQLNVQSFNRYRPLSPLPYEMYISLGFNYAPDSSYTIHKNKNHFHLDLGTEGFYFLSKKEEDENGLVVNSFGKSFPYVKTVNDLAFPIQLISTSQEFNRLLTHQNRKLAIDNFWIDNCGSRERAKPVIKKFYHRIEEANLFFTGIKEGWKTDQGMVYVIYGPPTKVYKNENSETWIYGEDDNLTSLNFVFRKIINPFTNNLYELNRSSVYKNSWYRMVDAWREGRIYTKNEE